MSLWGTGLCLGDLGSSASCGSLEFSFSLSAACTFMAFMMYWHGASRHKTCIWKPCPYCLLYLSVIAFTSQTSVQKEHHVQQSTHLSLILSSVHPRSTLGRELLHSALYKLCSTPFALIISRLGTKIVPYGLIL